MQDIIPQDATPLRQCARCKETYPLTNQFFWKDRSSKGGFRVTCKKCTNKTDKRITGFASVQEGYKRCTKCNQGFPATLTYFSFSQGKRYGLSDWCKPCANAYQYTRHKVHRPIYPPPPRGYRRCSKCLECKLATTDYFYVRSARKCGLSTWCRECHLAYDNSHIEERRLYRRVYRQEHPNVGRMSTNRRRMRKLAILGTHTPEQIREQYERQKGKCYYCSKKVKWGEHHIDHTFPISRVVGSDIPANDISYLVIACKHCNLSKNDRFPWEWPQGNRLL